MTLLRRLLGRCQHDQAGSVLVVMTLAMTSMIGFAALTLDVGRYSEYRRQLQNAADAAAHAAAQQLPDVDAAEDAANEYWAENAPDYGTHTISLSYPTPTSIAVDVEGSTDVFLMQLFGVSEVNVDARAVAGIEYKDVVLALDITASMTATDMTALMNAATNFVNTLDDDGDGDFSPMRVSVVTFPHWDPNTNNTIGTAGVVVPLTYDKSEVIAGIDAGDLSGKGGPGGYGTAIGDAINVASGELGDPAPEKIIVLMSDGANTKGQNPLTAASNFAGASKSIYTVGLGVSGSAADTLQDIADIGGGFYLEAPTSAELDNTFQEIARSIKVRILE